MKSNMKLNPQINEEIPVEEISYERANNFKRFSANLLDTFLSLLTGFILLSLTFLILANAPGMIELREVRENIALNAGLYQVDSNGNAIRANDIIYDSEDMTALEKSETMNNILFSFYRNSNFFDGNEGIEIYKNYFIEATNDDNKRLFDDDLNRIYTSSDYDYVYLEFYNDIFETSFGYLFNDSNYSKANSDFIIIYSLSIVATLVFPFIIFYYIVPLFFVRTRQTLGMKLCKIAIVNYDGLALKLGKFTLRFLFFYVVEILFSLVAFLIPLAFSLTMMIMSKSHQTLHDYLFSTYCVSIDNRTIYKDIYEYVLSKRKTGSKKLEDPSFKPYIDE